jgi:exonuclease III
VIRLVSWNVGHVDRWAGLHETGADVALLQEQRRPLAGVVPKVVPEILPGDTDPWITGGWPRCNWRTAVARLSDRLTLDVRPAVALESASTRHNQGTIAAADVHANGRLVFTAASVYAPWETDPLKKRGRDYSDASAHRILSDLSALMYSPDHQLIIAGDWNILFGYGELSSRKHQAYFRDRYKTVFDRADALGLKFVGPQYPNGRQADPWPDELPRESLCVPTFHHSRQPTERASRQIDFVFASRLLADRVQTQALNEPASWGASDHCRILIDVDV